jgi:8-oxo-dGTP pyrophosphatase MutT (NUDIX family)
MLDLDVSRPSVVPRDAATLVVLRDGGPGVEVFCVVRHPKSGFLGGAVVFPGGKVDPDDASAEWEACVAGGEGEDRPARIAGCREALEEAAILPLVGGDVAHADLVDLRTRDARAIRAFLVERGLRLDLASLHPFARWVTPAAESRRFDTRFYVTALPAGQQGAHDDRETTSSFWASAAEVLARFDEGRVQLLPPTHRTLEILAGARTMAEAIALASRMCEDPICPRLVPQEGTFALVLPGDPDHELGETRVPGRSRFVLRGDRWLPEEPPR